MRTIACKFGLCGSAPALAEVGHVHAREIQSLLLAAREFYPPNPDSLAEDSGGFGVRLRHAPLLSAVVGNYETLRRTYR